MTINRRRAPSSKISSDKKKLGHKNEEIFAKLINGTVKKGTRKGDVVGGLETVYSVKSGKKWQIFLYTLDRITNCSNLSILKPCLESFPENYDLYEKDRVICISYKETYLKKYGKDITKKLSNEDVIDILNDNLYINAKYTLCKNTKIVSKLLDNKSVLKDFYSEAIFNNDEVKFLIIKDTHYKKDGLFKVFTKNDVLKILTEFTYPSVSKAGKVPQDFNVDGQKILLCYDKIPGVSKNIVEIEVRNDSKIKYRLLRFNMYSKDALHLLEKLPSKKFNDKIQTFGEANEEFTLKFGEN
tara:strand:- start:29 stop:922 length:894 start_codon:yes stop_codon:yes gene_type:complete